MIMKKYKIYSFDQLTNENFSENDLYYLFDTPSLNYSLVVNMFRMVGHDDLTDKEILDIAKTNERWMYEYHWTTEQRAEFRRLMILAYTNIYHYRPTEIESMVDWWLFMYGMSVEGENLLTE